jgi:hypothetical protein
MVLDFFEGYLTSLGTPTESASRRLTRAFTRQSYQPRLQVKPALGVSCEICSQQGNCFGQGPRYCARKISWIIECYETARS